MKRIAILFATLMAWVGLALASVNINTATKEQLDQLLREEERRAHWTRDQESFDAADTLRTAAVVETPVSVASFGPPFSVKYAADGLDGTAESRTQAWPTAASLGCWQADKATIAGTSSSADFIPSPSHFGNT